MMMTPNSWHFEKMRASDVSELNDRLNLSSSTKWIRHKNSKEMLDLMLKKYYMNLLSLFVTQSAYNKLYGFLL